jgi:hypothetical protein
MGIVKISRIALAMMAAIVTGVGGRPSVQA